MGVLVVNTGHWTLDSQVHAVEDQDQVNVDAVDVQEVQDQVQVQVGGWKVQDGFS